MSGRQYRRQLNIEVAWTRLMSISDEAAAALLRTAFSPIITGAHDFAFGIMDISVRALAHSSRSVAEFSAILPLATRALLQRFPPEELRPGDILITNDPWLCAGHLGDVVIVAPVFFRGYLKAYMTCMAHMVDIGGTLDDTGARDVHEEGLWIPPSKFYIRGKPNTVLREIIAANVRAPHAVLGDIEAQIAACHVGSKRLVEFMKEFRQETLEPVASDLQQRAEAAMRYAISELPGGSYYAEMYVDGPDGPLRLCLRLKVNGNEILADYTGTSPQVRSGINSVWNFTYAETVNALKCILCPDLPSTEGLFRPITVTAPVRSLLNALPPAPVKGRSRTGLQIPSLVFAPLAEVATDRVQAGSGGPGLFLVNGTDENGKSFNVHLLLGAGKGATHRSDGIDCSNFPTSSSNVPIEIFENRCPVIVERKTFVSDSGGAGRQRGGCGQEVVLSLHPQSTQAVTFAFRLPNMQEPARGLLGGQQGGAARIFVNNRELGSRDAELTRGSKTLSPQEHVTMILAGGGGFGPVAERDPAALERDLANGFMSPCGSR